MGVLKRLVNCFQNVLKEITIFMFFLYEILMITSNSPKSVVVGVTAQRRRRVFHQKSIKI